MAKSKTRNTFIKIVITSIIGAIITWITEMAWESDKKEKRHGKK